MKTSIAMATHNGARFLSAQLDSFVAQSRLPDELIVVDDASNDSTLDIVEAFAERAPFSVLSKVNFEPLGYAQNFARALSMCSGDLIFLSDQDDVWFENKIETIVDRAKDNPGVMCLMSDALLTDEKLQSSGTSKMSQIRAAGLPESSFVMGCCVAVRRDFVDLVLPVPQDLKAHDNWLVGLADQLGLIHRAPEILQYYRRHGSNASDFYVNDTREITWSRRFMEYAKQLPRRIGSGDSLEKELLFIALLHDRIQSSHAYCEKHVGAIHLDQILDKLGADLKRLAARRDIRKMPRMRRLLPVVKQWSSGIYGSSGGALGALKDLTIRSAKE